MQESSDRENQPKAVLTLGDWRVDRELGRLVQTDGTAIQPEPKALELLLILAETPGSPVPRETLKKRLWNDDHIAPGALKHLIWQLRQDLGDDARVPRYIETVRGRGYRLVPGIARRETVSRPFRWLQALPGLIASGLLGGTLFWFWALGVFKGPQESGDDHFREATPLPMQPAVRPLTSLPGNEISPAMAPDGSFVIFAWDGAGENRSGDAGPGEESSGDDFDLFRIATRGGTPELLVSSPEDEIEPAISADGKWLAYLRGDVQIGGAELRVRHLVSGDERAWAEASGRFLDVTWLQSGQSLVVSEIPVDGAPARLLRIDADGSSRPVSEPSEQTPGDFFPAVSPDGEALAFYRRQRGSSGQILLLDLATQAIRPLSDSVGRVVGLAFDASGDGVIISSDRLPPRGIWRLSLTGKEARWLGLPGSFVADPASSRSGAVTYQDQRCDSNVWGASLSEGEEPVLTPIASLVSTRQDMQAEFSRDGGQVAWLSNRGGEYQIWVADWPRGDPRLVPTRDGPVLALDWAPDSQSLALTVRETSGVSVVHTVNLDGTGQTRWSDPVVHSVAPSWSADGEAIYYSVWLDEEWQLLKHDLVRGEIRDLGPGVAAKEEPDGQVLWVLEAGSPGLSRRPLGGEIEAAIPFFSLADAESWQPIDGGVVFIHWGRDGKRYLSRWMTDSQELQSLMSLDKNLPYPPGLSVSPDGESVLWTRIDSVASDLLFAEGPF